METTSTCWLAHVIAAAGDGVVVTDEDGRIILFNAAAEDLFGYPAEEVLGRRVEVLLPKRDRRAHREWVRSLLETRKPARRAIGQLREIVALRKGRVEAPVEVMLSRASFGNPAMLVALVRDVSERKKAEEQQRLLTAELSQRVRNILAVVQSIAAQGLRTSSSPEHFVKAFNGRLTALARAHDLLARKEEGIRLDVLIAEQVRPGAPGEEERIAIHGPPVALLPESALSLALTFHELHRQ
jgi:PAS domain S-box-containing protein